MVVLPSFFLPLKYILSIPMERDAFNPQAFHLVIIVMCYFRKCLTVRDIHLLD